MLEYSKIFIKGRTMNRFLILFFILSNLLFANSLEQIKKDGVLRVGVYKTQPPFSMLKDGNFDGFEVDFANAIAKDLFGNKDHKIEFIGLNVVDRIPFLQNNKVDMVIATFTITDERAKIIDFTMPYFAVNWGVLTRKKDKITNFSDLKNDGRAVIVENGATSVSYFIKNGFEIVTCDGATNCYKMLKENENTVGFANDNLIVLAYPVADKEVEVNVKNLGKSDFLGIGVQKGNKELLDFLNTELVKLSKDGFFKNSFDNFIDPFYKGSADKKYFLLEDIYTFFY